MQSMLPGAPWLLAHKSMLAVNRPRKFSLYGSDYVLWKDETNTVNALPNICPHMGAMLSEGWCESLHSNVSPAATGVACPFHALKFDGAGCTVLPGRKTKTLPQLQPLDLVVQGDFIWSYGGHEPQVPIPSVMKSIADTYRFVGHTADCSVETDLLSMLLIMHDYNHQNGTHRDLFRITQVDFHKFIDSGHQSHAFFDMVTDEHSLTEKLKKPDLFMLPNTLTAHIENHFPSFVILYSESSFLGKIAQCHFFIPEAENLTRTYNLLFVQANYLAYKLLGKSVLNLGKVVVEQDAEILSKRYADAPQTIRLNNEVGMDWVKRNFKNFPEVVAPNLSRS